MDSAGFYARISYLSGDLANLTVSLQLQSEQKNIKMLTMYEIPVMPYIGKLEWKQHISERILLETVTGKTINKNLKNFNRQN